LLPGLTGIWSANLTGRLPQYITFPKVNKRETSPLTITQKLTKGDFILLRIGITFLE
jgi:hypothetical protein